MYEKPEIDIIATGSQQAKVRVERNHITLQSRLIETMRRKKILTHEHQNIRLKQQYLPEHNRRGAAEGEDYNRQAPRSEE